MKTSTIYHRLHKLRESNILERYTIVVNPTEIGLTIHKLLSIRLKKMVIGKLDTMFLESFAKFVSDQYNEVLFAAVGDDEQIHCISTFRNDEHYDNFIAELKKNPYIDSMNIVNLSNILKGKKLFCFIEKMLKSEDKGEYFDDDGEAENEEDEKSTSEIFF